jgi:hypothetical protein
MMAAWMLSVACHGNGSNEMEVYVFTSEGVTVVRCLDLVTMVQVAEAAVAAGGACTFPDGAPVLGEVLGWL